MTPHLTPNALTDSQIDEITLHVQKYNPRLLSSGQRVTMLDDIRVAVLKSEPPTKELAGNWLSVLCKFIAQSTPLTGARFSDYFTDARIEAWVNGSLQKKTPAHTLRSNKGLLARILRAHNGLPVTMARSQAPAITSAPLSLETLALLQEHCVSAGVPALRGFVAGFCAGVVGDASVGARFEH